MASRFRGSAIAVAAAVVTAVIFLSVTRTSDDAVRTARSMDGHPNFSGIWQTINEANWDLEAHSARAGAVMQPGADPLTPVPAAPVLALGAAGGVPGSIGVVEGDGRIPYKPAAAAKKKENANHWIDRDPELKCFLPGVPRATYLPYPFQIAQGTSKIQMIYGFANAARTIHLDKVEEPTEHTWMGFSRGRWEGDALIVDSTKFNDKTWLDRAGNFHSDALHVVERFTPITPDAIRYEVTLEDPKVFTRPWKISMPIYRRLEPHAQLLEYLCFEMVEEFLYGHLRKEPLVKRWEGETIVVDITRKAPPRDQAAERRAK